MGFLEHMNERVKKLSFFDIKLFQCAGIFAVLILVKLIPEIMDINIWWFVGLLVICAIKMVHVLFIRK
jgi:fatty acid desaturase